MFTTLFHANFEGFADIYLQFVNSIYLCAVQYTNLFIYTHNYGTLWHSRQKRLRSVSSKRSTGLYVTGRLGVKTNYDQPYPVPPGWGTRIF